MEILPNDEALEIESKELDGLCISESSRDLTVLGLVEDGLDGAQRVEHRQGGFTSSEAFITCSPKQ